MKVISNNKLGESLTERKNVIVNNAQDAIINQATNILLGIQGKVSKKAWTKLIRMAASLDMDGVYAPAINGIQGTFEIDHPYPTHEGAESITEDPVLFNHLDNYSKRLGIILRGREMLDLYTERRAAAN